MMGPEAMGVANANLHWQDEKVCRNYLCGICPHVLFTNTVSLKTYFLIITTNDLQRKWTLEHVPNPIWTV